MKKVTELEVGTRILFESERERRPQEGDVVEFSSSGKFVCLGWGKWHRTEEVTVLEILPARTRQTVGPLAASLGTVESGQKDASAGPSGPATAQGDATLKEEAPKPRRQPPQQKSKGTSVPATAPGGAQPEPAAEPKGDPTAGISAGAIVEVLAVAGGAGAPAAS